MWPHLTPGHSMVKPIRPSPSERVFWWQVWKFFIPSLHTVTNVTVWRLGMKNSYLSPSENFIPKWWQIWILFIWWHTIWWHIHIDMKMNIFFRWWHVQMVTSMILIGEWYFFQMVTSSYGDNLKFSDHLPVTVWNLYVELTNDNEFHTNADLNNFSEHEFQTSAAF